MKISCPTCQAKYSIADEKVTNRLAKIRCRKCGAAIVIDGKVSPANVYTTAGDAPDSASALDHDAAGATQYSVDFGEGDQRNLTLTELVAAYNAGQVTAETYLWTEGLADWKPLGEIEEVVEALHTAASAPVAPGPSAWGGATAVPRAAARAMRAGSADLFGRIEHAGSEEDVTTSAPDHGATGARNESSVLFSLSALTSAASNPTTSRPSVRPATSSASSRDDSGLIDLKALTAAATKSEAAAAIHVAPAMSIGAPLGLAPPLGIAAPLGITAAADGAQPGSGKNKNVLYIALALAFAGVIIGGAIMLKPPPPPPPPAVVAIAPPPLMPPPAPADTLGSAKPPATGTAEESAGDKAAPKPVAGVRRTWSAPAAPKKPAAGGPAAAEPAGAAPAAPKPKRNSCGCSPGDLQCAMRCAAGG